MWEKTSLWGVSWGWHENLFVTLHMHFIVWKKIIKCERIDNHPKYISNISNIYPKYIKSGAVNQLSTSFNQIDKIPAITFANLIKAIPGWRHVESKQQDSWRPSEWCASGRYWMTWGGGLGGQKKCCRHMKLAVWWLASRWTPQEIVQQNWKIQRGEVLSSAPDTGFDIHETMMDLGVHEPSTLSTQTPWGSRLSTLIYQLVAGNVPGGKRCERIFKSCHLCKDHRGSRPQSFLCPKARHVRNICMTGQQSCQHPHSHQHLHLPNRYFSTNWLPTDLRM